MTASDLPPAEPGAGPYTVPKADLNQPDVIDRLPRPSVGDVLLLAILQVAVGQWMEQMTLNLIDALDGFMLGKRYVLIRLVQRLRLRCVRTRQVR